MDEITSNEKKSWWTESFQIEQVDPHTLRRKVLFTVNRWKALLVIGIMGVILFSFFYLIIGFTLLRNILPGDYSQLDIPEMIDLRSKVIEMERVMEQQDRYIVTMRGLLSGQPVDNLQQNGDSRDQKSDSAPVVVKRIPEEKQWRESPEFKERLMALRHSIRRGSASSRGTNLDINLIPPVIGPVGKGYDPGAYHYGIDILAPKNTAIKSIANGIVLQADWTVETGNTIMILHPNGMISVYKHNSSLLKKNYDKVKEGEAIAVIGNTGTLTTGPHVHFELWVEGFPEDPSEFINFQ